jgi:RecA/RadA recombinase
MITLILGRKGSGKTKKLIDMCAAATAASNGNVVFIEKDSTLTYDLSHKTRLVAADESGITGYDAFYGFIAGMCAGNYDITDIFVDSTLKIGGADFEALAAFVERLSKLDVNLVLSVSADKAELPARIADYAKEI